MASDINEDVSVTVTEETAGIARAGFGTLMIPSCNATFGERIRFYNGIGEVAEDFAPGTPEYLAADAAFAQDPHLEQLAIGKLLGKPTQRYKVSASLVENGHTYRLKVSGPGIMPTEVAYTADASATDAEIAGGLVAALNAVRNADDTAAQSVYLASGAASPIAITALSPGAWFSLESVEVAYLKIEQDHAEPVPSLATDLNAIAMENGDWYGFVTLYNSDAYVKAAAAWAESYDDPKIYIADLSASETVTLAKGGGDTADDLKELGYARTAIAYHPSPAAMFGAAWFGRMLPTEVGRATWKFKRLAGVTPTKTTATHRQNIKSKNVNTYRVVGVANTRDGKTCDGDFIDVTRNLDWFDDELQKSMYELFISEDIVPLTNTGLAQMESVVRAHMERAIRQGVIDGEQDPPYLLDVPDVEDIAPGTRALREVSPPIRFSKARLQGAVHKVNIRGSVTK